MSANKDFGKRFAEACGTAQPAQIQRSLNIPYQSAKNYLNGRMPQAEILIRISDETGYSIDWLLTGRGKKFLDTSGPADTPRPAGQIEESVRRICVEVINELNAASHLDQPKTVRLQPDDLMSEKATDDALTSTGRRR